MEDSRWELSAPDGRLSSYPTLSDLYWSCAALFDYQDELIVTFGGKSGSRTGAQLKQQYPAQARAG
jgi:hypothetical protein